ncbi:hypothetical protein ACLKA6_018704 [Drosophila palustris]
MSPAGTSSWVNFARIARMLKEAKLSAIVMVQRCKQGRQGIRCPTAQDRPYVVKNHILHEVPLLPTKYGGSREDNSNKTRNLRCYSNRA